MSPDRANIFGNRSPKALEPLAKVPVQPNPSQMTVIPWVQLPMWVQSAIASWLREYRPGIKGLAYHWNQHLTKGGRITLLKHVGVD